jgi:catechol 2,3-dioxygenase-like lactoylglutathione lyase family enzyme
VAVSDVEVGKVQRVVRFSLTARDAGGLAVFYERALGFHRLTSERLLGPDFESLMDVDGGAESITLCLGREIIELLQFDRPGQAYPQGASSSDLVFQHFAIVVADIHEAYRRLLAAEGWSAISTSGPQRLPERSGGVTAFKFRDPEGHPLELLAFAPSKTPPCWQIPCAADPCLGIDHSAISVFDSGRSVAFYEALGFQIAATSSNDGPAQARLDALREPLVEVTALAPSNAPPHIELLCYQPTPHEVGLSLQTNDVAATRVVLAARGLGGAASAAVAQVHLLDPDGHHLLIVPEELALPLRSRLIEKPCTVGGVSSSWC